MTQYPAPPRQTVTLVTRGSPLALWQADYVTALLAQRGVTAQRLVVKTTADRVQDRFLHEMGGKGLFVKELEDALLDGRADLAVHSLKDMPAVVPAPFRLAAVLKRHAPTDVMIFRRDVADRLQPPAQLSAAATQGLGPILVGTGSLRRQSLLKKHAPGMETAGVRGNVDTRLRKLDEGSWDALILAEASLDRLSLKEGRSVARLTSDWFIPCAAQGALAIESRADDRLGDWLSTLGDDVTTRCVTIERGVLSGLGGDCTLPFGCFVRPDGQDLVSEAQVLTRQGRAATARWRSPLDQREMDMAHIEALIRGLKDQGAAAILGELGLKIPEKLR